MSILRWGRLIGDPSTITLHGAYEKILYKKANSTRTVGSTISVIDGCIIRD